MGFIKSTTTISPADNDFQKGEPANPLAEKFQAIHSIELNHTQIVNLVKEMENTSHPAIREAILIKLCEKDEPEVVAQLLPLLASEKVSLRNAVLESLNQMPQGIIPHLNDLLFHSDVDVRIAATSLLGLVPHPERVEIIWGLLKVETSLNVISALLEHYENKVPENHWPVLKQIAQRWEDPYFLFLINQLNTVSKGKD